MQYRYGLILVVLLHCTQCFSGADNSHKNLETTYFTISVPKVGWVERKELPKPYLFVLISEHEGKKDTFNENIVVYRTRLGDQQSLEQFIKTICDTAREKRPDFKVVKDSKIIAGSKNIRRQVCTMTFPEFVSKNIQYFLLGDGYVYVMTASIPEKEFKKWSITFDTMVQSFRLKDAGTSKE